MKSNYADLLKSKMDDASFQKLVELNNEEANDFIGYAIKLSNPDSVWFGNDSDEDAAYCRQLAVDNKEEIKLNIEGHTVHFDGYNDQARKKDVTTPIGRSELVIVLAKISQKTKNAPP